MKIFYFLILCSSVVIAMKPKVTIPITDLVKKLTEVNEAIAQRLISVEQKLTNLQAKADKDCSSCEKLKRKRQDSDSESYVASEQTDDTGAILQEIQKIDARIQRHEAFTYKILADFLTKFAEFYNHKNTQTATIMFGVITNIVEGFKKEITDQVESLKKDMVHSNFGHDVSIIHGIKIPELTDLNSENSNSETFASLVKGDE